MRRGFHIDRARTQERAGPCPRLQSSSLACSFVHPPAPPPALAQDFVGRGWIRTGAGSTLTHLELRENGERRLWEKGKEKARMLDRCLEASHSASVCKRAVSGSTLGTSAGIAVPRTAAWARHHHGSVLAPPLPRTGYLCPRLCPEFDPRW